MNSTTTLRSACASVLASVVSTFPAVAEVSAVVDRPAGWAVSAAPADPVLALLSEEQLIDRLCEAEPAVGPRPEPVDPSWAMGGVVNLGSGFGSVMVHSPAAVELTRRGWRALPALLDHLMDARPTKLVYAVLKTMPGRKAALAFSDEYDPRADGAPRALAGVNTGERAPLDDSGIYTFRVGELCYATLGQIVNRDLRAVRCNAEGATFISGSFSANPGDLFRTINSPILRPALAAAARADWGGITARAYADSLRGDFQRAVPKPPANGGVNLAQAEHDGALTRLLFYFPPLGTELAEAHLQRKLIEPVTGTAENPDGDTVSPWTQAQFVAQLAPFRSDRLQAALLDLFRRAAALAEADLRLLPPASWDPGVPSLGSDLALVCAKRLVHQGHDDELKAFFSARVAAIEAAIKAPDPGPGKNPGAAKFVNGMQAGECRKFLAELEAGPVTLPPASRPTPVMADARVRLGPVSLARTSRDIVVTVVLVEPVQDRMFAGRVIIDRARDDVGVTLWPERVPPLAPVAVGRTGETEMRGLPKAALQASLTRAAPGAKALALLEGRVELVVPDFDPDSIVVVKDITGRIGSKIESQALRVANMSITLLDRAGAAEGERSIRARDKMLFGDAQLATMHFPESKFVAGDIALSMSDPDGRFLNVEFRDADGQALRYNHDGWSHSSTGRGERVDIYRLGDQIPAGTQMVVWLRTEKSHLIVPLKATNLPLPAEPVAVSFPLPGAAAAGR